MTLPRDIAKIGLLATISIAFGQSSVGNARVFEEFEVASIRPAPSTNPFATHGIGTLPGGRVSGLNVTLRDIVAKAYGLSDLRVLDGPKWADSLKWNFDAKVAAKEKLNYTEIQLPLRKLLGERFKLRTSVSLREMKVNVLRVGKKGLKNSTQVSGVGSQIAQFRTGVDLGALHPTIANGLFINKVSMDGLADNLTLITDQVFLNQTNLPGEYLVTLGWIPEPGDAGRMVASLPPANWRGSASSLVGALQDIGLTVSNEKRKVDVVSILDAQLPSEN